MRSGLKKRVHALIAREGVQRAHADLFGSGGRRFLDELALRPDPRQRLETLLRLIGEFDREIDARAKLARRAWLHVPDREFPAGARPRRRHAPAPHR